MILCSVSVCCWSFRACKRRWKDACADTWNLSRNYVEAWGQATVPALTPQPGLQLPQSTGVTFASFSILLNSLSLLKSVVLVTHLLYAKNSALSLAKNLFWAILHCDHDKEEKSTSWSWWSSCATMVGIAFVAYWNWCWRYPGASIVEERKFDDLKTLINHQKAKTFQVRCIFLRIKIAGRLVNRKLCWRRSKSIYTWARQEVPAVNQAGSHLAHVLSHQKGTWLSWYTK